MSLPSCAAPPRTRRSECRSWRRARSARRDRSARRRRSSVRPTTTATSAPSIADADRQQSGNRNVPALVERDEKQIGEQDGQSEHDAGAAARRLFLQRRAGPFVAVAGAAGLTRRCAPWRRAPGRSCSRASARHSRSRRDIRCSGPPSAAPAPASLRPAPGSAPCLPWALRT